MVLTRGGTLCIMRLAMHTFREVIAAWPSLETLAEDAGVSANTAKQWRTRNKIPDERWAAVAAGADRRGLPVTLEVLADLSARRTAA